MNVAILHGDETSQVLRVLVSQQSPAIMSYLSAGKWHVAKVHFTGIHDGLISATVAPKKKPHPLNIRAEQPVGVSLKHGYGKFIFETTVVSLEPSLDGLSGGTVLLRYPESVEILQRRSFFRVSVPETMRVNVLLWHRGQAIGAGQVAPDRYKQGSLVDISAGGMQIAVRSDQEPDFHKGQFIGVRFTPMPYETPLMFNGQVRSVLPTADGRSICLGVQMVGLEASCEGRMILQRLCNVVERYHNMNQSDLKQQDFKITG